MKIKWKQMDEELTSLSDEQLREVTRKSYNMNLLKIAVPELFLTVLYLFLLIFFICFNHAYEERIYKVLGYIAMILLTALPVMSMLSVRMFYRLGDTMSSYRETLTLFKKQCERFNQQKYVLMALNIILVLLCVILIPKVYSEYLSSATTVKSFIVSALFAMFFFRRVWRFYGSQIRKNEELLKAIM